jgi:diguanylate cyclase (GGDEF)-like protein/PAS domain S-box-containing protein
MRKRSEALARRPGKISGDETERDFEQILNSMPHVMWSADANGFPDFVSAQWGRDHGGDPSHLTGNGWADFVHPDDLKNVWAQWLASVATGNPYSIEYRIRLPDGSYRCVLVNARAEKDQAGKVVRWFGGFTDISDRVLAEKALRNSERLHRSLVEASADCIKVITLDGRVQLLNTPGLRAMEFEALDDVRGKQWSSLWPGDMRGTVEEAVRTAAGGETIRFNGPCLTRTGMPKWWDVVVTPVHDDRGEVSNLLAISRDITDEKARSQELLWASEHDSLTLLPNRRAFQARLQAAAIRAMAAGTKLGLLLVDLDHFKHVNDTMGHSAGDSMLQALAGRIREAVRPEDFVARIGGDEFAIILEGVVGPENLLDLGKRVSLRINAPVRIHHRALSGGASIGGAIFPDDARTANDLFKLADTALYRLKAEGRGGTRLFESHMLVEAQLIASQLSLARDAVNDRTVVPYYQPKVKLTDGSFRGFEALLRWQHPSRGLQLPETIEQAFNDYELASKIGEVMQTKVAADVQAWLAQGFDFGRLSINASPAEFLRDDYAEGLLERLREHRVPPRLIEVEVTEHVLMERGSSYVARALARLKAAGVTIALDDFGTGYSSLSHLRDFPVDVVKIDKSFVSNIATDNEIAAIVAAVVNLARSLGLETVAEGVETRIQADLLRAFGCDLGQGFLFGEPIHGDAVRLSTERHEAA